MAAGRAPRLGPIRRGAGLRTRRLTLRSVRRRDVGELHRAFTEPAVRRYLLGPAPAVLAALLAVSGCAAEAASGSRAGRVIDVGEMGTPRAAHTSTALGTGEVLITGGCVSEGCEVRSAATDLYDPTSGSFRRGPDMSVPRVSHAAARLPDGTVLVTGGWSTGGPTATAELYDPAENVFRPAGSMSVPRGSHVATLLADGRVLITGGEDGRGGFGTGTELYDPDAGAFTPGPRLEVPRASHVAVRLPDGSVLVAGGRRARGRVLGSAEIFDPATESFSPTGDMTVPRHKHGAAAMVDGRVLVAGGSDARDWRGKYSGAETFDPATGDFHRTSDMANPRFKLRDAVVALPSGEVVVAGGAEEVEVFDPGASRFRTAQGSVDASRQFSAATLLADGTVLITGGYDDALKVTARAWAYRP